MSEGFFLLGWRINSGRRNGEKYNPKIIFGGYQIYNQSDTLICYRIKAQSGKMLPSKCTELKQI